MSMKVGVRLGACSLWPHRHSADNRTTEIRSLNGGYRDGELCDVRGLLYEVQLLIIDSDSDFVGSILRSRTYFVPPSARNVVIVAYSERMTN